MARRANVHVGLHGLKATLKVSPMQLNQLLETLGWIKA